MPAPAEPPRGGSEGTMHEEPTREHAWLKQLVGEWAFEGRSDMGDAEPERAYAGTETVERLGDFWVVCHMRAEHPDGRVDRSTMTLGYDPRRARFVGTFISDSMSHQWLYEGTLDEAGRVLTLGSEGPGMEPGQALADYRDSIVLDGSDRRLLTSAVANAEGGWDEFMVLRYRRTG